MGNLVFISGGFSSGSTLLFTLFRRTGEYYCLYEPLGERLVEYLFWPPRLYEHHFFVENYYSEYKGFREIPKLLKPHWGVSGLYLPPTAEADDLYRYLSYLIGTAFGRSAKVVLKENRLTFRLGWLRTKFPQAKVIHIHRDKEAQWNSIVRRVQARLGREKVGQGDVMFQGSNIATWCEDLKSTFPQLDAKHFQIGYDRFCKLWELSRNEHQRYADISVDYWALTHDFEATFERVRNCVGGTFDIPPLKQFVIPPEDQRPLPIGRSGLTNRTQDLFHKAMRGYAKVRVRDQVFWRERIALVKNLAGFRSDREGD